MNEKENVLQVLKHIVTLMSNSQVFYILGGRTGLFVQGVAINLDNEIDICTNSESIDILKQLFGNLNFEFKESETFKAKTGTTSVEDVNIEFMADPFKRFFNGEWIGLPEENIHQIEYDGYEINVFTLESEYEYYKDVAIRKPQRQATVDAIKYRLNALNR